MSRKSKSVCKP